MKKQLFSILLALALLCSLATAALAADVVLSPQSLTVNGNAVTCEKYNIDGSNYFKLRDLAKLLNGTESQFSVGWDAATQTVTVTSGEAYEEDGSELVIGADKSATAVPSSQTICINGAVNSSLSVYNLDGNNFFKLRDLGDALRFRVDFDAATNTAIVESVASKRVADTLSYTLNENDNVTVSDLIFNGDVNIYGDNAVITFANCEFNGCVINNADLGTNVRIFNSVFAENSVCILSGTLKDGSLDTDIPKFTFDVSAPVPVSCDSMGAVVSVNGTVTLNGNVYTMADAEYYLGENGLEPYTGQPSNVLYIGHWWENGEAVSYKIALNEPAA